MPYYILPSGETKYVYNGTEYIGYGVSGIDPKSISGEGGAGDQYSPTPGNPTATSVYDTRNAPGALVPASSAPMVNEPTSGSTRSVLGAEQDPANPWDPEKVRRNAYDVGY
jgi:hypothetical protein